MRIAVVGSGIAGLTCAHRLSSAHEVTLFEALERLGGHTHTVRVDAPDGTHHVDTGFIVFNDRTYPGFVALMERLGVESQPTTMSFSVRDEESGLEYNPSDLGGLFAQRRNLFDPRFHRMVREILRFHREAPRLLDGPEPGPTLGEYLAQGGYSERFVEHYILPMGCAIWSSGTRRMRRFPARYFVRFFQNHGMLSIDDRPTWRVLRGGSSSYLAPLTAPFRERIHLGDPVRGVRRHADSVTLRTEGGHHARFDHVILAVHSDQALRMLEDPSDLEKRVLTAIPYQKNDVVLHTDTSLLPRSRRARAAWNYNVPGGETDAATLTYDMNVLQGLEAEATYCVSVNPGDRLDPAKVLRRFEYAHPVFLPEGVEAQALHPELVARNRTSFAGAYWGFGFHEDGVQSALRVCAALGCPS